MKEGLQEWLQQTTQSFLSYAITHGWDPQWPPFVVALGNEDATSGPGLEGSLFEGAF
jgi:hypothetical protein